MDPWPHSGPKALLRNPSSRLLFALALLGISAALARPVQAAETDYTWLFNSSTDGWTASSGTSISSVGGSLHVVFATGGGVYTPVINYIPGHDTYHRDYIRFAYQIVSGTVAQLQFNFSTNTRPDFQSTNYNLSGLIRDGQVHHVTFRVDNIGDWLGTDANSRITRMRFVAIGAGGGGASGTMNFDFMALREDDKLPQTYSCPRGTDILSVSPPGWTNGAITVTVRGNDPGPYLFPECGTTPPDEYGSGVAVFRYAVNGSWSGVDYTDQDSQWPTGWSQTAISVPPGSLRAGTNSFQVHANDRVGFQATSSTSTTLYFDPTPPSISDAGTTAPGTYNYDATVTFSLDDGGLSGVQGYSVTWDNPNRPASAAYPASSGSVTIGGGGAAYTSHALYVHGYDNVGNSTTKYLGSWTYAPDHSILATASAGGSISPSGTVGVGHGASQAFTFTPSPCFHVADVLVDGGSVGPVTGYTFTNVTTNHSITANFARNVETIAASAGAHGAVSPSGAVAVVCGADQTFTMTPEAGYSLTALAIDGQPMQPTLTYTFTNVVANHTLVAGFADITPPEVRVVDPNGGDSVIVGTLTTFRWTATDGAGVASVDLSLSRDRGATWEELVAGIPNTGMYDWTATGPALCQADPTEILKVAARDAAGNVGSDVSDAPFTLYDLATGTLLEMFAAVPIPGGVELRWRLRDVDEFTTVTLERADAMAGPWLPAVADPREVAGATVAIDRDVSGGRTYYYRLSTSKPDGQVEKLGLLIVTAGLSIQELALRPVAPNPSRGAVRIEYALPRETSVRLSVVDLQGREIAVLSDGRLPTGSYQAVWRPGSGRGGPSAGIYFVRLNADGHTITRRVVITP